MLVDPPSLRPATLLAAGVAYLVLAAACTGQVTSSPAGAGGAPHDGPSSSSTGGAPSGFNGPCHGCPGVCTAGNACVQCVQDSDCAVTGNAGFTCQNNTCVCVDDAQCADDVNGAACMGGKCACNTAADCGAGMPACPEAGGVCGCTESVQCTNASLPACDVATAQCVACSTNADCAGSPGGPTCTSDGSCTCAGDTQCAGSPLGLRCITGECGCQASADCGSSAYGAVCSMGMCSCSSNADCPAGSTCTGQVPFRASICQ